jgi:hypothetical protein
MRSSAVAVLTGLRSTRTDGHLRLLVTGSRDFSSAMAVREMMLAVSNTVGLPLYVTDGKAPGLDTLAHAARTSLGWPGQRFEARWEAPCRPGECNHGPRRKSRTGRLYCPAAGGLRNQLMVDQGQDLCVGWLSRPNSLGTRDCLLRAHRARIPTLSVEYREHQWIVDVYSPTVR